MKKSNKGEEYLKKFPKLKKWINECALCHSKGYKPSMSDKITNVEGSLEVYYLKKYFKPLSINKDGLCPFCENKFRKNNILFSFYKNNKNNPSSKHYLFL